MLTVSTGEQIWGLLDIVPDTFDKIPETLDAASKKDIVSRIEHAETQREWAERIAAVGDLAQHRAGSGHR